MQTLKTVTSESRQTAVELLESRGILEGGDKSNTLSRRNALLFLASAVLQQLESECVEEKGNVAGEEDRVNCAEVAKQARKSLRGLLPKRAAPEEPPSSSPSSKPAKDTTESEGRGGKRARSNSVDLGQYASTTVFGGDESKTNKFARLMGGGKGGGSQHSVYAADQRTMHRVNKELEDQFSQAIGHKGRKGLGA